MDLEEARACCEAVATTLTRDDVAFLDLENAEVALSLVADHIRTVLEEHALRHGVTTDLIVARATFDDAVRAVRRAAPFRAFTSKFILVDALQSTLKDAANRMGSALTLLQRVQAGNASQRLILHGTTVPGSQPAERRYLES